MIVRLFLLGFLILSGCKKNDVPQPAQRPTESVQNIAPSLALTAAPFLSQPIPTTVIETTNAALPIWRSFARNHPPLIIVANTPAMISVPPELHQQAKDLLKNADDIELIRRSSPNAADPLLLPAMSLSSALDADWVSEVIWIFPAKQLPENLDLVVFQKQLVDARIATAEEAATFILKDGCFRGIIHNHPFTAAQAEALPSLEESALLHVDADYFKPLYHGEIKTPLYPLMLGLLNNIKGKGWKIAAASIALSNQQYDGLPLATRFLGKDLAILLQDPKILKETFPEQWKRRSNALYLENFIQKEAIRQVYLEMEKDDPGDPAVKFGLYTISRELNKPLEALEYLHSAAQIDGIYSREYLSLAELAMQKKRPEKAVEMLQLARKVQPANPFILTTLVRTLLNTGHQEEAKALQSELANLNWSRIYYPQQAEEVAGLLSLLQ